MSIAQLPRLTVLDAVSAAEESLADAASAPTQGLATDEIADSIAMLAVVESRAQSLRMALSAQADARQVANATADTGTDAWLARLTGDTREALAGGLRLANLLETKYAHVRHAFAAGRLRINQVRVIVNAAEQAPTEATPTQLATAEQLMVDQATGDSTRTGRPMNAKRLRQAVRRMFDPLDHDLANRHEAILLNREARTADAETYLALHDNADGTYSGRFMLPELHGSLLRAALDQLTSPRRLTSDRHGHPITDDSAVQSNRYENDGAAFCELIEHLPTAHHAPVAATIIITMEMQALLDNLDGLGTARMDTGTTITAGHARRLACGAGLVPAVLNGPSMPLDLGRSRRLHDTHQRRALALLYDTCAIEGCQRPFNWTEIHHPHPWSKGGPTNLTNALPLCGHHHRKAHDHHWELKHHPDDTWRLHYRRPATGSAGKSPDRGA